MANLFNSMGYRATVLGGSGDQGVDLILDIGDEPVTLDPLNALTLTDSKDREFAVVDDLPVDVPDEEELYDVSVSPGTSVEGMIIYSTPRAFHDLMLTIDGQTGDGEIDLGV